MGNKPGRHRSRKHKAEKRRHGPASDEVTQGGVTADVNQAAASAVPGSGDQTIDRMSGQMDAGGPEYQTETGSGAVSGAGSGEGSGADEVQETPHLPVVPELDLGGFSHRQVAGTGIQHTQKEEIGASVGRGRRLSVASKRTSTSVDDIVSLITQYQYLNQVIPSMQFHSSYAARPRREGGSSPPVDERQPRGGDVSVKVEKKAKKSRAETGKWPPWIFQPFGVRNNYPPHVGNLAQGVFPYFNLIPMMFPGPWQSPVSSQVGEKVPGVPALPHPASGLFYIPVPVDNVENMAKFEHLQHMKMKKRKDDKELSGIVGTNIVGTQGTVIQQETLKLHTSKSLGMGKGERGDTDLASDVRYSTIDQTTDTDQTSYKGNAVPADERMMGEKESSLPVQGTELSCESPSEDECLTQENELLPLPVREVLVQRKDVEDVYRHVLDKKLEKDLSLRMVKNNRSIDKTSKDVSELTTSESPITATMQPKPEAARKTLPSYLLKQEGDGGYKEMSSLGKEGEELSSAEWEPEGVVGDLHGVGQEEPPSAALTARKYDVTQLYAARVEYPCGDRHMSTQDSYLRMKPTQVGRRVSVVSRADACTQIISGADKTKTKADWLNLLLGVEEIPKTKSSRTKSKLSQESGASTSKLETANYNRKQTDEGIRPSSSYPKHRTSKKRVQRHSSIDTADNGKVPTERKTKDGGRQQIKDSGSRHREMIHVKHKNQT